ncbi:UNVERIFIED_ORG: polar amino acid transport system permease protein [Pseudomonas lini]
MTWEHALVILSGLPWTLAVTGLSLAIGMVLGLPLMFARNSSNTLISSTMIMFIALVRAVPPIVWLFIVFFGMGNGFTRISPFIAAVLVFGLIATTNMAEIYRGGMLAIHAGQHEATTALNFGKYHAFIDVVLPQMLRVALPAATTYAIGLLKDSAVASTIGVLELAYQGRYVTETTYMGLPVFATVGAIYIVVSIPIAIFARYADARMRKRVAR